MLMSLVSTLQQQDAIVAQLDRMGTALVILAWSMGVVGLMSLVAIVLSLYTMRTASRLISAIEGQINRLAPKTEPLVEKMTRLADDASAITDMVRRRVGDLMDTVADLNGSMKGARREAEKRIREFAAVLDVVQTEAEQLLLDAAATARGVQVTAAALRGARRRRPPDRDDYDEDEPDLFDDAYLDDDEAVAGDPDDDEAAGAADPEDETEDPVHASVEYERENG
jgi:uncharacterized protein YoxC